MSLFSISIDRNESELNFDSDTNPPQLVSTNNTPLGGGLIAASSDSPQGGVVDVVKNFYWTYSKLTDSRQEVPRIILRELRLKTNALVAQLKYTYGVASQNIREGLTNLQNNETARNLLNLVSNNNAQDIQNNVGQAAEFTDRYIKAALDTIPGAVDENTTLNANKSNYLFPYKNLYITKPTGWVFNLPYFDNYSGSTNSSFSNDASNPFLGLLKSGVDLVRGVQEMTSVINAPTKISFVEQSKFFNYPSEGEEISFSFPLINTGSATFNDVVNNWQLLFLLMYNNKPARKNSSIVEPPVIYEIRIPGVKFMPYAYISSISVEFQGSRRELNFNLATTGNLRVDATPQGPEFAGPASPSLITSQNKFIPVRAIVPDAYVIRISVKGLIADTKNTMYNVLDESSIVTTRTLLQDERNSAFNTALEGILDRAQASTNQ
jgi:hypothetical protein